MGKPYSDDLRERVVAAIEAGHTREEVAKRYNMALSTVGGFIKKSLHAAEQDRPDVAAARKAMRKEQLTLDPKQLVFIDETAATCPMDGPHFLAYVEQILAPTLKKGQIVFLDNVSTHKVGGVEEAIKARGARAVFLPAYRPDLNPIEQLFATLKSFFRKMKARTVEELWRAIASFLKGVSKEECKSYLANSGYT